MEIAIKSDFTHHFILSIEAFGLLVLDNKLDLWNQQFEAKKNNSNAKIHGSEYKKKYIDLYQKGPSGWSVEGKAIYYVLNDQSKQLREIKKSQQTIKWVGHNQSLVDINLFYLGYCVSICILSTHCFYQLLLGIH